MHIISKLLFLLAAESQSQPLHLDPNLMIGLIASAIAVVGFFKEEIKSAISSGTKRTDKITEALIDRNNLQGATILSLLQQNLEDAGEERRLHAEKEKQLTEGLTEGAKSRNSLAEAINQLTKIQSTTNKLLSELLSDRDEERKAIFELSSAVEHIEKVLANIYEKTK
jgi:hypothetical protein